MVTSQLASPSPRIAIHVVCSGWDDVIAFVNTTHDDLTPPYDVAVQTVRFQCAAGGQESRVELAAPDGANFQSVSAIVLRLPDSTHGTSYSLNVEVPSQPTAPSESPSLPSEPVPPSISVSPAPSK